MKRLALLSVALLLVIPACATTQPNRNARQLQNTGEKYLAAGDTANALQYLTEAEQKSPDDPVIQYDLALAYDKRELHDKALEHLRNALKLKPNYPEAQNALGAVYAKRGQYHLAQEAFQKALDDPFYKTPQLAAYNIGSLYEKKGDIDSALTSYQHAVKLDPQYGAAWFKVGQILEQMHRDDEARHAYGKAVNASPDLAEAQLHYGILSYKAGDTDAAIYALNRVGKIAPDTSMADEARVYLQKLSAAAGSSLSSESSHARAGEIEFIQNEAVKRQRTKNPPPSQLSSQPAPPADDSLKSSDQIQREAPKETETSAAGSAPASFEEAAAAPGRAPGGLEPQPYKYIVQVGSFVDREKADEVQQNLAAKGYSASVKSVKHHSLGKVFVIQLQPVNSISKATTLMVQLSGEIEGQPEIIKVPSK
jgi:Tfp pilus assembly protein PilF